MNLFRKLALVLATICFLVNCTGCYRVPRKLEPQVSYAAQDSYIKSLPSAFPPLTMQERNEPWGQEYKIGMKFAKDLDLYRAISTLKRSEILIPENNIERLQEVQYLIVFCYYLGKKYEDVIDTFQASVLKEVNDSFTAYHDLLLILYESYREQGDAEKADYILTLIKESYPETAKKLLLSTALMEGNISDIEKLAKEYPNHQEIDDVITHYERNKKSIAKAEALNAVVPGAGYWYVGQKQSALTALLLNGLFIAAACHFFHKGQVAAGAITTSIEAGWYFGGIYGAGESAKLYNERVYEDKAYAVLSKERLFPVLMLHYGF